MWAPLAGRICIARFDLVDRVNPVPFASRFVLVLGCQGCPLRFARDGLLVKRKIFVHLTHLPCRFQILANPVHSQPNLALASLGLRTVCLIDRFQRNDALYYVVPILRHFGHLAYAFKLDKPGSGTDKVRALTLNLAGQLPRTRKFDLHVDNSVYLHSERLGKWVMACVEHGSLVREPRSRLN